MKRHQSLLLVTSLFFISAYAAQAPTPIKVRPRGLSEPVRPDLNKKSSSNDSHVTPPDGSGSRSPQIPVVVGSVHGSGSRSPQAPSSGTPTHKKETSLPKAPDEVNKINRAALVSSVAGGYEYPSFLLSRGTTPRSSAPTAQEDPAQQRSGGASLRNSPKQQLSPKQGLRTLPPALQPQPQPASATTVGILAAAAAASIKQRHDAQFGSAFSAAAPQPTPTPATAMQVLPLPSFAGSGSIPADSKQNAEQLSPPSGTATTQASPAHASTRATTMPPSLASTPSPGNSYRAQFPLVSPTAVVQAPVTQDTTRTTVPTDVVAPPGHTSRGPRRIGGFTLQAAPAPQSPWSCPCAIL